MNLKLARTEINAKPAEISLEKLEEEVKKKRTKFFLF